MSTPSIDPAEVLHAVNNIYISRLLSVVACTLALYDWLLVLNTEMQTIYTSRWTLAKGLFYYIRIITPPGIVLGAFQLSNLRPALSKSFCQFWMGFAVFGMLSSLFASNALFALRLIALYKRNKYVVWFIHLFFLASYAATFGLVIDALATYADTVFYSETFGLCTSMGKSKTMPAIFYAPSAFEAFVFVMTAYRALKDAKYFSGASSAPFLTILYRDGIVSFIVMVAVRIWNVWIYATQPLSSFNMGTVLMWSINTVITTRVYLNLVWLAKKPLIEASQHELSGGVVSGGIRMRVHTFTEVRSDTYKATGYDPGLYTIPGSDLDVSDRSPA